MMPAETIRIWRRLLLGAGLMIVGGLSSTGATLSSAELDFFESKIRPVLVKHCYECHSTEAETAKGSLLLDSREGLRAGGDRGPAVTPGEPAKSLLLTAITHADPDLTMPPKKAQLPKSVIADLEAWIRMGAPDPREATGKTVERAPVSIEDGRQFWSYKKPVRHEPPDTKNPTWASGALDRFVLARLEENGLAPSPDAEPTILLRRLHFDLVGLPPSPDAVSAFAARVTSRGLEAALAIEVDRLLAAPQFGERWGRHWLDVARFAESSGKESNLTFPHAWRYRDYVIDAFNADKPFDRFLTEQLAGDLLAARDDAERAQLLIATGFLAFGPKSLNEMNKIQFMADLIDEQIDSLTRAVMASSVACARCHDHKFDPFSMADYYSLAGIFLSTKTQYGTWIDPENNVGGVLITLPRLPGQLIPNKAIRPAQLAKLKQQLADLKAEKADNLRDALRIYWGKGGVEGKLATVDDEGNALPLAMGVLEAEKIQDAPVLERGEIAHPGERVPRGFPRVIEIGGCEELPPDRSGRLELARWLTSPEHPLTARVMANRVWRHLFGAGLVRTTDNFGYTGERPSHPELLDHLALKFVENGWSVKSLIREIVRSRAYRQASAYREECFQQDPDNRLLWRANQRRLEAEIIRDSMLAVSGRLDLSRRPGSLVAELNAQSVSLIGFNRNVPADLDGSRHRSVYLPVLRDRLPDVLYLFDFAEPTLVTGDRDVTNVPLQALYLMNSAFVQEQAAALAKRATTTAPDLEGRLRRAFVLCFSREPDANEMKLATRFFEAAPAPTESEPDQQKLLTAYCQSLLCTAEFRIAD